MMNLCMFEPVYSLTLFLFVHCFVNNLVDGLRSFLRKVVGLFYVKIHVLYILAYKSIPSLASK